MRRGKNVAWRNDSLATMHHRRRDKDRWKRAIEGYLRIAPIVIEGASEAVKAYDELSRALERIMTQSVRGPRRGQ